MIHKRFFREFEGNNRDTLKLPDVKDILVSVRREIFSGCSFVFSGLLHQKSSFEDQEIWKMAVDFGAECEYEINDRTTHLISNRIDTEKALESKERGIPAVRPEWIYESCRKWEKLDWKEFQLEISGMRRNLKRSAADLEAEEDVDDADDMVGVPILDEAELEEIQRELADLEDDEEEDSDSDSTLDNNNGSSYEDAELSDGDFSDLLNELDGEEENE